MQPRAIDKGRRKGGGQAASQTLLVAAILRTSFDREHHLALDLVLPSALSLLATQR